MPRGKPAEIGDRTTNKNGYEYIRTKAGWVGAHVLVMEEHLGRSLSPNEYVAFTTKDHSPPITLADVKNGRIELRMRGDRRSIAARRAVIQDRIEQLQAELKLLDQEERRDR